MKNIARLLFLLLPTLLALSSCSDADRPDAIDATVVPPLGSIESRVITAPVTNCSPPLWMHNINKDTVITQRVNSPSSCPGDYYWDAEPHGWRISSDAAPPVRSDGHGACTWSGPPSLSSAGCVWERSFTCPYSAANGGTFSYRAVVIAQDVDWWDTSLRLSISSHSGACGRLVTARFDL